MHQHCLVLSYIKFILDPFEEHSTIQIYSTPDFKSFEVLNIMSLNFKPCLSSICKEVIVCTHPGVGASLRGYCVILCHQITIPLPDLCTFSLYTATMILTLLCSRILLFVDSFRMFS